MEVRLSPELEASLTHCPAQQGCTADELVQEVLARYLADEARLSEIVESWTDEERRDANSHIEEGLLQTERGELIDASQVRREIQHLKSDWRRECFTGTRRDQENLDLTEWHI